jgi:hypothetical protein
MIQKTIHKRICKCGCGDKIETTKNTKVYADGHQKINNNMVQNEKRKRMAVVTSPMMRTYWIYNKLLGKKDTCKVHIEFLRGKNADLTICSGLETVDGEEVPVIKDIAITIKFKMVTLKRIKL